MCASNFQLHRPPAARASSPASKHSPEAPSGCILHTTATAAILAVHSGRPCLFGNVQLQAVELSVAMRQLLKQVRSLAADAVLEQMRRQAICTLHIHAHMSRALQHAHAHLLWRSEHGYDMQSITQ